MVRAGRNRNKTGPSTKKGGKRWRSASRPRNRCPAASPPNGDPRRQKGEKDPALAAGDAVQRRLVQSNVDLRSSLDRDLLAQHDRLAVTGKLGLQGVMELLAQGQGRSHERTAIRGRGRDRVID